MKNREKEITIEQFKKYKICDYDSMQMNEVVKQQLSSQGEELLRHGTSKKSQESDFFTLKVMISRNSENKPSIV